MWAESGGRIVLGRQDRAEGSWDISTPGERTVLHLVVNSSAGSASERARLYVNGVEVLHSSVPIVQQDSIIFLAGMEYLGIGNEPGASRSLQGKVSYVAIYDVDLSSQEIANNAAILQSSDDSP